MIEHSSCSLALVYATTARQIESLILLLFLFVKKLPVYALFARSSIKLELSIALAMENVIRSCFEWPSFALFLSLILVLSQCQPAVMQHPQLVLCQTQASVWGILTFLILSGKGERAVSH